MPAMFDVKELVKVAVQDEKSGVVFYTDAAAKTEDPDLKETFTTLAEQERSHQQQFEGMLAELGDYKSPEGYSGEHSAYLTALASDRAFPTEAAASEAITRCSGDRDILELALRIERDTLILMEEMQKLVAERNRDIVETLANEERSHVVMLTAARDRLGE